MTIKLSILCVDGETHIEFFSQSPDAVLDMLKEHDHEGSHVTVKIEADDEEAYKLLELVKKDADTREHQLRLPILPF